MPPQCPVFQKAAGVVKRELAPAPSESARSRADVRSRMEEERVGLRCETISPERRSEFKEVVYDVLPNMYSHG